MENGTEAVTDGSMLYDPAILKNIDWESRKSSFRDNVSPQHPGEHLILRPLCLEDFEKGHLTLLSQLTKIGDVTKEVYTNRFQSMKASTNTYYVTVLEDTSTGQIIGSASLIVEQKFIRTASSKGRVEDVIVYDSYRGKQLGKLLVEVLTLLAKSLGCYKVSLECKEENVKFYQGFGYEPDGQLFMVQRFKD